MVASPKKSEEQKAESSIKGHKESYLILHNDDVNTFDDVIQALCEVCHHDVIQAEQCAMITHYKGKCEIMQGEVKDLVVVREQLIIRNLSVTID